MKRIPLALGLMQGLHHALCSGTGWGVLGLAVTSTGQLMASSRTGHPTSPCSINPAIYAQNIPPLEYITITISTFDIIATLT